jgi:hypothetical protein
LWDLPLLEEVFFQLWLVSSFAGEKTEGIICFTNQTIISIIWCSPTVNRVMFSRFSAFQSFSQSNAETRSTSYTFDLWKNLHMTGNPNVFLEGELQHVTRETRSPGPTCVDLSEPWVK